MHVENSLSQNFPQFQIYLSIRQSKWSIYYFSIILCPVTSYRRAQEEERKRRVYCVRFWSLVMVRNQPPARLVEKVHRGIKIPVSSATNVSFYSNGDVHACLLFVNVRSLFRGTLDGRGEASLQPLGDARCLSPFRVIRVNGF